ncbi:hypothetical protein QZH41_009566, partial [Actinostola sp. cb2023]
MFVFNSIIALRFIVTCPREIYLMYLESKHIMMRGVAHTDESAYFIEPLPDHLLSKTQINSRGRPHIVYRRASTIIGARNKRSDKKESVEIHTCGTTDDPRIRLSRSLNETADNDRDGPAGPGGEKYIESLVVVDPKMANFHGIDASKQYALTTCNIASSLLRDSSLGDNPVNFVVSRMQILTTPQPGLIINHHAGNTLESFGKWAERNNNPLDNDENHYDYAALLTSLGINHDGINCGDGSNVMSTFAPGKVSAFQWSQCSKNYIKQFLDSKDSKCLDDQPTKREIIDTKPFDMPGSLYDADQQCQLSYGEDSRFCHGDKFLDQICVKLWCEVPEGSGKCKTAQDPAADGTLCGGGKWCKRGQCVTVGKTAPGSQDGGWSKWSDKYSKCSRSCGGGVQYKERRCNNPRPQVGGKRCAGVDREYRLCSTNACPKGAVEFRNYQCKQMDSQMFNDQFYNWEWKPSTLKNRCVLGCFIEGTGLGFAFGNAIDGTNCDASSANKCIQGVCKKVGCDSIIDSRAVFDRCGVCDGDGSSCSHGKSKSTASKKDETPRPEDLLNNAVSWFKNLGFTVDRRGHIASPDSDSDTDNTFYWGVVKSGCSVACGGGKEQSYAECRRADDGSPVNEARCDISKKPPRQEIHCNRQPCPPSWRAEGWEDCTKTCNGGNRTREVKCMQVAADGVEYDVDQRLCTSKKPATIEACNTMSCQPEWVSQPFGECSTHCGRGVQKRTVICMQSDKHDNLKEADESMCEGLTKPTDQEYCNVHNPCPGEGGCGGNLTTDAGSLTSPNFPSDYPNNKECIHAINVSPGKVIKVDFHTMQIASPESTTTSEKCTGDFVKIMDGECNNYRSETLYCGKDEPAPYISTDSKLCIKFYSDQSQTGQGFKASYLAVDRPENPGDQCGATLTAPIGLLTSPNYPDTYPGNEVCNTTIKVAKAPVKLAFQAFDVGSKNCDEDYVMLQVHGTDGFRKLCGNSLPQPFTTTSNELTISFKSGPKIGRAKAGFVATYTSGTTPEELRQQKDKSGIRTFNSRLDEGLMNVPVAKDIIPKPKSIIEIPKDIDVNFKPISKIDSEDASKDEVDDISESDAKEDQGVEDAIIVKTKKLQNALTDLDSSRSSDAESESGSGSGSGSGAGSGAGSENDKPSPKKETKADETSGSGETDDIDGTFYIFLLFPNYKQMSSLWVSCGKDERGTGGENLAPDFLLPPQEDQNISELFSTDEEKSLSKSVTANHYEHEKRRFIRGINRNDHQQSNTIIIATTSNNITTTSIITVIIATISIIITTIIATTSIIIIITIITTTTITTTITIIATTIIINTIIINTTTIIITIDATATIINTTIIITTTTISTTSINYHHHQYNH